MDLRAGSVKAGTFFLELGIDRLRIPGVVALHHGERVEPCVLREARTSSGGVARRLDRKDMLKALDPATKADLRFRMCPYGFTSYYDTFKAVQEYNFSRFSVTHPPWT